jgi:recombinational DNA repair ATPase RecF
MSWGCSQRCSTSWQKEVFENGAAAFQAKARPDHQAEKERIAYLEKKIQRKDEVLAELMGEHIALKQELWGTLNGVWVPHEVAGSDRGFRAALVGGQ